MNELLQKIREPFPEDKLEWRVLRSGVKNGKPWAIVAPFIQSRAIMDRLDDVVGPENWSNEHRHEGEAYICEISLKLDEWISKSDGAGATDIESVKGGISDAFKRAAVLWGIGRYLYDLPTPMFAVVDDHGRYQGVAKDQSGSQTRFNWNPPAISSQSRSKAPVSPSGGEVVSNVNSGGKGQETASAMRSVDEVKSEILMLLKNATDDGYYPEDEFIKLMGMVARITDYDAAMTNLVALKKKIAEMKR